MLDAAVLRHPRLALVSVTEAAETRLELHLRCNPQVCSSRLIRFDGDTRRADTRALLPDASEDAWSDRVDQGIGILFPPGQP